jgi:glycosyltransferase involved in cell wall biosynthesis
MRLGVGRLRLLTVCSAGNFFANAGMAEVERALMRALVKTHRIELRVLVEGDPSERRRLAEFCHDLVRAGRIELVPRNQLGTRDILAGIDGLMLHSIPRDFFDWILTQDLMNRLPVVQHLHSLVLADTDKAIWGAFWRGWQGWPPARLIAPSESTARRARGLQSVVNGSAGYLPRIEVIPHAVDADDLSGGNRRLGRKMLGVDERALLVLSLNRISPDKTDYRQLLWAFRYLHMQQPQPSFMTLALVGGVAPDDVAYVLRLKQLAEVLTPNCPLRVIQHVEGRLKRHILAAADVLVSLSGHPQESFGIVLLEGLAAGVPIVASDWNGHREALPSFYHPLLVPTLASHAVALAPEYASRLTDASTSSFRVLTWQLRLLLEDQGLRASLGQRGRAYARSRRWSATADTLVTLWLELDRVHRAGVRQAPADTHDPNAAAPRPRWFPRSPVDGLATSYLETETRLHTTRLAQQPSAEDADALSALVDADALSVLAATTRWASGQPITLEQMRAACGLSQAAAERHAIELVRFGLLELGPSESSGGI